MERQGRLYPIGIQTFSEIINKDYLYIDKTECVPHDTLRFEIHVPEPSPAFR